MHGDWGARVKSAREAEGFSQKELADHCGVSKSTVSQWETGKTKNMRHAHLLEVAAKLGRNPRWISYNEPPEMAELSTSDPRRARWNELYDKLLGENKLDAAFRLLGDTPDQQAK